LSVPLLPVPVKPENAIKNTSRKIKGPPGKYLAALYIPIQGTSYACAPCVNYSTIIKLHLPVASF